MLPMCLDMGVGCVPYSPQGKGRLTRPWGQQTAALEPSTRSPSPSTADADQPVVDAVQRVAEARGVPMAQVALAWVLSKPVVAAPIVGATKPHHLADAVAALDLTLTDDEIQSMEAPYTPQEPYWWWSSPWPDLRCHTRLRLPEVDPIHLRPDEQRPGLSRALLGRGDHPGGDGAVAQNNARLPLLRPRGGRRTRDERFFFFFFFKKKIRSDQRRALTDAWRPTKLTAPGTKPPDTPGTRPQQRGFARPCWSRRRRPGASG